MRSTFFLSRGDDFMKDDPGTRGRAIGRLCHFIFFITSFLSFSSLFLKLSFLMFESFFFFQLDFWSCVNTTLNGKHSGIQVCNDVTAKYRII